VLGLLLALLGVGVFFSPLLGTVAIAPETVLRILLHQVSGGALYSNPCAGASVPASGCTGLIEIVWDARLSEIMLAVVVGAGLGISGGTLQGVFRNPLADPFLLGISSGGTLGAAVVVVFRIGVGEENLLLPLFAFIGAIATGAVILAAARSRFGSVETLLLTGVALSSFLSSVLSLLLLYNPTGSLQVDFWLLGNLGSLDWTQDLIAFPGTLLPIGIFTSFAGAPFFAYLLYRRRHVSSMGGS